MEYEIKIDGIIDFDAPVETVGELIKEAAAPILRLFEERIEQIKQDISRAIKHDRGLIIIASYRSDWVRAAVQDTLSDFIREAGHSPRQFIISPSNRNVTIHFQKEPAERIGKTVRFGKWSAYNALHVPRKLFMTNRWLVVIWLKEAELPSLANTATDFWVFRHRYVEFIDPIKSVEAVGVAQETAQQILREERSPVQFVSPEKRQEVEEQIAWREQLIAELPNEEGMTETHAYLFYSISEHYHQLHQFNDAERYAQQALTIYTATENGAEQASTLHQLGIIAQEQREWETAERYYKEALAIWQQFDNYHSQASTLHQLGIIAQEQREWETAERYYKETLTIWQQVNDRYEQPKTLIEFGKSLIMGDALLFMCLVHKCHPNHPTE